MLNKLNIFASTNVSLITAAETQTTIFDIILPIFVIAAHAPAPHKRKYENRWHIVVEVDRRARVVIVRTRNGGGGGGAAKLLISQIIDSPSQY